MKKYIKDNKIIYEGTPIIINNIQYFNPSEEIYLQGGWQIYNESKIRTLEDAKQEKIDSIINYDISNNVNNFIVNGQSVWISKVDRIGLMNSTNIEISEGKTNTTLWLNNIPLVISCTDLINMLSELEEYALQCYNVTEQHKASVLKLNNIDDVDNFDITLDYPTQLVFNI